jgi:magnesium chelatase family protein
MPRVPFEKLSSQRTNESSAKVRERVEQARAILRERFKEIFLQTDSAMGLAEMRQFCQLDATSTNLSKTAMQQLQLNTQTRRRILKLARTIADLAGSRDIQTSYMMSRTHQQDQAEPGLVGNVIVRVGPA